MGALNNLYVSSSYQGLLKMTDSTNGLTNTLQTIQTGDGDNSPLQMSLTEVNISGSFYINNVPITNGSSGTSGTSGVAGSSGTSGTNGSSGQSGSNGTSGTSGSSGGTGSSGTSGTSGVSGSSGTSGSSGVAGSSGTSGQAGSSGTSGTSGVSGSSGTSGDSGSSGTSGSSGQSGSSGTSGVDGSSGSSGTSGQSGSSGTSGASPFAQTGSWWNTTNNIGISGSLSVRNGDFDIISNNTTVNNEAYLTSSLAGQSNIIKGWGDNPTIAGSGASQANYTGSLRITGSNNTVSLPQIRATLFVGSATDLQGYISGSDNVLTSNNSGIYLNTGSLLYPKTANNYVGLGSGLLMNFTTSSIAQHPIIQNNTLYAGSIIINSNSGSLNAINNLINGGQITSTQNFVTNVKAGFSSNILNGASVILSHVSSSINYNNNFNNSQISVINAMSSSIATNVLGVTNNVFLGGAFGQHTIFVSGSQSSNVGRNISSNLLGGTNINVSSSFISSSNANLISTIAYGNNLHVSASNPATTFGGSAFFGRFNATGSNLEDSQQVVFAVGTGTAVGARKTGFLIDSGSNTTISGSLRTIGNTVITGSLDTTGNINNLKIWTGSLNVNSIGIGNNTLAASTGSSLNNVAIGDSALSSNVSGANSVAIGNATLQNSAGGFNVAIGGSALNAATTATENVAIGSSSTQALTLGIKNTAIGFNSMVGVVSGSWNVSIGAGTLQRNISGSNCVAIGNQAGSWSTNSNEFFVGNDNYGNQISEQSSSIFYGKFNNTTANQSLQINAGQVRVPLLPNSTGSYFVMQDSTGSLSYATPEQALPTLFDVGYFYSTTTQSGSANTSGSFTFDNTVPINEVTVSGSRINIPKTAWYNFQFSIQAVQGSGAADVAVWLKENGTNVSNTATYVTIPSNHKQLISLNIWEQVSSGSYIELAYQSDSANTTYQYITPTGNIPGSPSVIMSVNQIR